MTNPPEGVADDVALDRELPRIDDVAVEAAAAQWIAGHRASIRRRLLDRDDIRVRHALRDTSEARLDALTGNRAGHQHHLTLVARDHRSSGCRLLDGERDDVARLQHGVRRRRRPAT
jgi:hypothetical protein